MTLNEQQEMTEQRMDRLADLVQRHMGLVYAAALRQMRDPHRAADVTQAVFMILQKRLPSLGVETFMPVWLLRTTQYACLAAKRQARRRAHHEAKVKAMPREQTAVESDEALLGQIDDALARLGSSDRETILMAYFEGCSHARAAARLGVSEAAARKRLERAMEKLRKMLRAKGGMPSAAGAAAVLVAALNPGAAPAAVGTGVKLALNGTPAAGAAAVLKGTLVMLKVLKMKIAGTVAAVVAVVAVGGIVHNFSRAQTGAPSPAGPNGNNGQQVAARATPAAAATVPVKAGGGFLAEATMVINDDGVETNVVGDLDKGAASTPPQAIKSARSAFTQFAWMEAQGVDLTYESSVSTRALLGIDMAIMPAMDGSFAEAEPASIIGKLLVVKPAMPAIMTARAVPATYYFRTREGGVGVLEVVRVSPAPSSVEIRYRLLTPAARDAAVAEVATERLLPDIQRQLERAGSADVLTRAAALKSLAMAVGALSESSRGTPWYPSAHDAAIASRTVADIEAPADVTQSLKTVRELVAHTANQISPPAIP
jgi:RNA polymerase sigma factor (sigma-70 family)